MKFQSWKHKEAAWKKIAPRAQEMEKETLYCRVQGNHLYAMEARYNSSCRNSFNTEDHNYECGKGRPEKEDSIDSLQAQKLGAHQRAYENVKNYVLEHVNQCNEVIQLTFLRDLYVEDLAKSGFPNSCYSSEKFCMRGHQKNENTQDYSSRDNARTYVQKNLSQISPEC